MDEMLSAEQAAAHFEGLAGPAELLAALLEDPARAVAQAVAQAYEPPAAAREYRPLELVWHRRECSLPQVAQHLQSQPLVRPLLGGRHRSFRIHRFELGCSLDSLVELAVGCSQREPGLDLSNLGGFHSRQDMFDRPAARQLCRLTADCVRAVAAAECEAAGAPEPREGTEPNGWVNVSGPGDLNQLHCHAQATLASVLYAQVPEGSGHLCGSLLFRLTPGRGISQSEPDEERHVPWMAPSEPTDEPGDWVVYAELVPVAGELVVFPGWLSHAVSPTCEGSGPRVSFAANWDFQTEYDDYDEDWRWFKD